MGTYIRSRLHFHWNLFNSWKNICWKINIIAVKMKHNSPLSRKSESQLLNDIGLYKGSRYFLTKIVSQIHCFFMEHQYTVIPFYSFLMSLYSSSLISIVKSWSIVLIPDCGQWGINNVVILIIFYESKFSTIGKITIASLSFLVPVSTPF